MNTNAFVLTGLALALQAVTIALGLRRARAEGHPCLMWGLLALGIWPVALLALLVTKPVPLAGSGAGEPDGHPGMSVYTPFILNGAGLLILVGLTQASAGDTSGVFLAWLFSLMAVNAGMLFNAFVRHESGLAVCYFLVLGAGLLLLLFAISGWGHR